MKKICLLLFLAPFLAFSKEDTLLCRKKFNLTLGFDLSIPQVRYGEGVQTYSYPNGWSASPQKPIFNYNLIQNGFNFTINTELKIYKNLYIQSGLSLVELRNKSYSFRDTLFVFNGTVTNTDVSIFKTYNIIVPIGMQYRIRDYFFTTLGVTTDVFTLGATKETEYRNTTQIISSSGSGSYHNFPDFHYYLSSNIRLHSRFFLNLKVSNTFPNRYDNFTDNLYYSLGIKFFVI